MTSAKCAVVSLSLGSKMLTVLEEMVYTGKPIDQDDRKNYLKEWKKRVRRIDNPMALATAICSVLERAER